MTVLCQHLLLSLTPEVEVGHDNNGDFCDVSTQL